MPGFVPLVVPGSESTMRLSLILPPVPPAVYPAVETCPYAGCGGQHLQHWQAVPKPLRDTQLDAVIAQRSRCALWSHLPPLPRKREPRPEQGPAQGRGRALVAVLGMSYGAVATALAAMGRCANGPKLRSPIDRRH